MTETTTETPQAWVGCLACYNAGRLVGRWVDGTEAGDIDPHVGSEILEPVEDGSPHEERWVFDFQGYDGLLSGECSPVEAQKVAEAIERIDAEGWPIGAVAAYRDNVGAAYFDWERAARDLFMGDYWSAEAPGGVWVFRS